MAEFQAWYRDLAQQYGIESWIGEVFLIVLAVVVMNFIAGRIVVRVARQAERSRTVWDDAFVRAVRLPLNLLIWLLGISFAADVIRSQTEAPLFEAVPTIRYIGAIALVTWFLVRLGREVEAGFIRRGEALGQEVDRTTVHAIGKLVRLSLIITGTLVALQTLGVSISGILAFGGIGGIAIGFAAKDLLANFFGAMMIYLDRPFAVGDWIRSPDKDIEGTVEDIGWRLTRIRRFDKRPLYVPNAVFASIAVENPSRMTHRRIYETIGIRYDDIGVMDVIVHDVREMLLAHAEIDQTQTLIVNFNAFNASSIDFFVYTFTRTTEWVRYHEVKHAVLLEIARIIEAHGAEIAFPTRTLHLPEGVRLAGPEAPVAGPTTFSS